MVGNLQYSIALLLDNHEYVREEAVDVLLTVCSNILKYPHEMRYRNIKLSSSIVNSKLLPARGAIECLLEAGFVESDDGFVLPLNASLAGIEELFSHLNKLPQRVELPLPTTRTRRVSNPPVRINIAAQMCARYFKQALRFEDKNLQTKVKAIVPLEKLQFSAMEKLREVQRDMKINNTQSDIVFEDLLLSELLNWFKTKFFRWVSNLKCSNCMSECIFNRMEESSNPQISRIEIQRCNTCGEEVRFPRFSDPEPLLTNRQGRCGEWATCFTLICRTVGFDARIVYSQSDHVWTEVWSDAHKRWIHADACENVMDQPLLYERGWGTKLSSVMAFSKDEVQDVTWRYTRKFDEVMKRRNMCSESELIDLITKLNEKRQTSKDYSEARRNFVLRRRAIELAEMITAPPGCKKPSEEKEDANSYGGRTSGSLSWRVSRGEVGSNDYKSVQWKIAPGISSYQFTYYIINDTYAVRDLTKDKLLATKQRWQNGIDFTEGRIFRKEEHDWKNVYLARSPGSTTGKVTWTFEVEDSANMSVDSIKLHAITETFEGGSVKWEIEGTDDKNQKKVVPVPSSDNFETKELKGAIKISVSVVLSGGQGEVAWQHAQLFRRSLIASARDPSMLIKIDLSRKHV